MPVAVSVPAQRSGIFFITTAPPRVASTPGSGHQHLELRIVKRVLRAVWRSGQKLVNVHEQAKLLGTARASLSRQARCGSRVSV